ncbi:MAG: L-threonylcarbamoyladenylate synthase [Clostridiales bacterium]|nr:L-threonylcarbamoyladenylate synthase [Clostridiales bacterium]
METVYIKTENGLLREDELALAAGFLQAGELVAFPTETVYGLGANALDAAAVARIFAVKGRPADNPLIVHLAHPEQLEQVAVAGDLARALFERFSPGPLTLVLPKKPCVPDIVSAGLPTVAVRFPAHPAAKCLLEAGGLPVAAPSANLSGRPSPTRGEHVAQDLGGKIAMIIDAGPLEIGLESTVLDVTGARPVLLRPGGLAREELERFCGPLETAGSGHKIVSPGMKYAHYAPRGKVIVAADAEEAARIYRREKAKGSAVLLLSAESAAELLPLAGGDIFILGGKDDLSAIAANLFAAFRLADERQARAVIVEGVPEKGLGLAIMNRIKKASGSSAT